MLIILLKKIILKNLLLLCIEQLSVIYYFLYSCYNDLGKTYIKAKFFKCYNKYIYINNYYYINISISNLA
jgi:hypothetical protein